MENIEYSIEMAIRDIRKLAFKHGLIDCEIRSIFNKGLIARFQFGPLAEAWIADQEIQKQKSEVPSTVTVAAMSLG